MILSPQWALLAGIILSFFTGSYPDLTTKAKVSGTRLLQLSVVLLGSSLNFHSVLNEGATGALLTFISIAVVFFVGFSAMKILGIEKNLGTLITMGTAICGGSAIAALAPVIAAESMAITISIAIVFLLNALSVFLFPPLGNFFGLSESAFGIWAAIAIHDTSSVVAASSIYGVEALAVATTIKLTRALWIIPITITFSLLLKKTKNKVNFPWFVIGFLVTSLAFTFFSELGPLKSTFFVISKNGFAVTLFLIGLTFDLKKMRQVGLKPFVFGVGLWIMVSVLSLLYVRGTF
jgi:uncharacterized integral membrane protein (TIGR00698 family)